MKKEKNHPPGSTLQIPICSLVITVALMLTGCVSTAGIEHSQSLRNLEPTNTYTKFDAWPQTDWWKTLNSNELNQLVTLALQENPSIVIAAKRIEKAQAYANSIQSTTYPQVSANSTISQQRLSENSFYPPPYAGSYQTLANASLDASWELDFWNKNRNALNAALSLTKAEQAEQSAVRLMVSTAVARTYFQLARQFEQQKLAQQALKQREQELTLIKARIDTGLDTNLELEEAQGIVSSAKVDLEATSETVKLTQNALSALTAQTAETIKALNPLLPAVEVQTLPQDVPVDLIGRRPDLAAARARVEASTSAVAAAKAEFYPNVSLSAFIGLSSFGLSKFLDLGSTVAGIGPAIHLPIFDAGRLRANLQSKNSDLDIAIASYNQTLLDAVHDVADQITSLSSIHKQFSDQQAALTAAESAYQLANLRFETGVTNYLTVLTAADRLLKERRHLVDIKTRQLDVNLTLIKSLGGGFNDATLSQAATR